MLINRCRSLTLFANLKKTKFAWANSETTQKTLTVFLVRETGRGAAADDRPVVSELRIGCIGRHGDDPVRSVREPRQERGADEQLGVGYVLILHESPESHTLRVGGVAVDAAVSGGVEHLHLVARVVEGVLRSDAVEGVEGLVSHHLIDR